MNMIDFLRGCWALYEPSVNGTPYLAVLFTEDNTVRGYSFETEAEAKEFLARDDLSKA